MVPPCLAAIPLRAAATGTASPCLLIPTQGIDNDALRASHNHRTGAPCENIQFPDLGSSINQTILMSLHQWFRWILPKSSTRKTAECEQDSGREPVKLSTQFRNGSKSLREPVIPPHSFR